MRIWLTSATTTWPQFNDIARVRMAEAYNKQRSVVQYAKFNCVGVRIGALKPAKRKKAKGSDCLPCIVINVLTRLTGTQGTQVQHQQYKLLCEFGVVVGRYKVDDLVPGALNNFPELVKQYQTFTHS